MLTGEKSMTAANTKQGAPKKDNPRSAPVQFYTTPEFATRIADVAQQKGVTVSSLVEILVRRGLAKF